MICGEVFDEWKEMKRKSNSISVDGATTSLESVDNVDSGDSLPFSMFSEDSGVLDDGVQEVIDEVSHFAEDSARDSADSSSSGKSPDASSGQGAVSILLLDLVSLDRLLANLSFSSHFINKL